MNNLLYECSRLAAFLTYWAIESVTQDSMEQLIVVYFRLAREHASTPLETAMFFGVTPKHNGQTHGLHVDGYLLFYCAGSSWFEGDLVPAVWQCVR